MTQDIAMQAKAYLDRNREKLIEQAIDCCVFSDDDPPPKVARRYERLLRTMAQRDQEQQAAAAYMFIAVYERINQIFDKETGARLLIELNAFDAYQAWLRKEYEDIFEPDDLDWYLNEPVLIVAEMAYGLEQLED